MEKNESYIWLFCLDHPNTNITRVSFFIVCIFVTDSYMFYQKFLLTYATGHGLNAVIC